MIQALLPGGAAVAAGGTAAVVMACAFATGALVGRGHRLVAGRRAVATVDPSRAGTGSGELDHRLWRRFPVRLPELPSRRRCRRDEQLVDLVERLAMASRNGDSLPSVSDVRRRLVGVVGAGASARPGEGDMVIAAVAVGNLVGGSTVAVFDAVGAAVRDRIEARRSAAVASASSRASAWIMTALPVLVVAVLCLEPSYRSATFASAPGLLALGLAGVLDATGWWWMRKILGSIA